MMKLIENPITLADTKYRKRDLDTEQLVYIYDQQD